VKTCRLIYRHLPAISLVVLLLLLPGGCSDICYSPEPSEFSISGHLTLEGTLRDEAGAQIEDTTVYDAGGVIVYLAVGDSVLDSTAATGGLYRFEGRPAGKYRVVSRIGGMPFDVFVLPVVVEDEDVTVSDTLEISTFNNFFKACPNPSAPSPGGDVMSLDFDGTYLGLVIKMYDMGNRLVNLIAEYSYHSGGGKVTWFGVDESGEQVPPGLYWAVLESHGQYQWDLVFVQE
jgi:hypothetical protein